MSIERRSPSPFQPCIVTAAFVLGVVISCSCQGDVITLLDGQSHEGEVVSETEEEIVIKGRFGRMTIPQSQIKSIVKQESKASLYRKQIETLEKSERKGDCAEWEVLAKAAEKDGAIVEMREAWQHVSLLDPANEQARRVLRKDDDAGLKLNKEAFQAARNASRPTDKEKLAHLAGVGQFNDPNEKPVVCPRCTGSGVSIFIDCLQCIRSPKRGYINLGDKLELCPRCQGQGKLVGVGCDLCKRKGRVLMSQILPADGGRKLAPAGFEWCSNCNGTGVSDWIACNQCKRSKWPGYNFFGDKVEVCNRCCGLGKLAGLSCGSCAGRKIVPIKR